MANEKKDNKRTPANAPTAPETTPAPVKEKAKAGTSVNARIRKMFSAIVTELQDAGDKALQSGILTAETIKAAVALAAEAATSVTRGVPAADRLKAVNEEITAIYVEGQKDFSVLTTKQAQLQALFVKKQNLERRITTEANAAKKAAEDAKAKEAAG